MRLLHRVAVVTGAGKGIGLGIAKEFAKEGAAVIIATIEEDGEMVAKSIEKDGGKAFYVQTDVSSEDSIIRMVSTAVERYGTVDILVNNAGITEVTPLLEATIQDWDHLMNIDLRGVFLCSKHIIPFMQKNNRGSIINISSVHASATLPNYEIYAAAKSGVNGLTRGMALSFGKWGIRVNAISPGFTDTPHLQKWLSGSGNPEAAEQEMLSLHPIHTISTPEHIAKLALYLASEESGTMTGSILSLDGGISARLYHSDLI